MFKEIMNFYYGLSISKKLRFLNVSMGLIVASTLIIMLFSLQYVNERKSTVEEANTFAKILADNIIAPMSANDFIAISNVLASVEYNDKIRQTFALDPSWKLVGAFHKGNDFLQKRKSIALIKEYKNLWKGDFYYCVVPIVNASVEQGYLVVVASLHDFYIRMLTNSFYILIIIFLAFIFTHKLRKIFTESILQPISKLDSITSEIIRTKNMNYDIPIFNNDEIGDLAKNFKHMTEELNTYYIQLKEQKNVLSFQATHDSLTNLPNRALFNDRLEQSIYRAKRQNTSFALLFIDLDNFKEVNDTFGHECGDKLLQKVSKRFKSIIREEDTLARLGGDEFTIIMGNTHDNSSAAVLAQKVLDTLNQHIDMDETQILIGCSIGISLYPQDASMPTDLIKHADIAMYKSKDLGRNNYNFYASEMKEKIYKRVMMQSELRYALEHKEFVVYYQPQYNAETGALIGLEALVRWMNSSGKIIFPGDFIPMAAELGMIIAINNQVMLMAMRQTKQWYDQGLNPGRVSININVSQTEDEGFIDLLEEMLFASGCKAEWISLELTESEMMKNPDVSVPILQKISDIGMEIAIDDFGTGYSSLSHLKRLCVHKLKIDKTFVDDILHSHDDVALVRAIIAIAKSLNIGVIAEGVETQEQLECLLKEGCSEIQGYLYARPMPLEDVAKELIKHRDLSTLE
jgi:diguanylate cyclase (GGDEF)-like protein